MKPSHIEKIIIAMLLLRVTMALVLVVAIYMLLTNPGSVTSSIGEWSRAITDGFREGFSRDPTP